MQFMVPFNASNFTVLNMKFS